MSQILLLTKNTLNEETFEKQLSQLGHEVFTSTALIDVCLFETSASHVIKIFHYVILSETIANAEVKQLVRILSQYSIPVFRKSDEQLGESQLREWKELGITEWIESEPVIEVLREKLSCSKTRRENKVVFLPKSEDKVSLSTMNLSSGELKLFHILYEQQRKTVSREELCLMMWNKNKSNSSMSQLSVMVKHLKDKLNSYGVDGPVIETCWGRGYRLHEVVYEKVYIDSPDEVLVRG